MCMQFLSLVFLQKSAISILLLKEVPKELLVNTIYLPLKCLSLRLSFIVVVSSLRVGFESHLDVSHEVRVRMIIILINYTSYCMFLVLKAQR